MKKRTPPPLVHQISATVRNASVRDPGEATIGYYVVGGGTLTLTDERGLPPENQEPVSVANDSDCRAIAKSPGLDALGRDGRFNRQLEYRKTGLV
jgi:hypothetical protein